MEALRVGMMRDDVAELYRRYRSHPRLYRGGKMTFHGVDGRDVYNPTAPFRHAGGWCIAARVEVRNSERAQVCFFAWDGANRATLLADMPEFALQDPFISEIDGQLVFGGVEVSFSTQGEPLRWRTQFFIGENIATLRPLTTGPWGMKDIRLLQLPDGRILVFTRPQGEPGGRGTIGWTIIPRLQALDAQVMASAALISHVDEQCWCGVNAAYLLPTGNVGVLAHVAGFDALGNRHYYAARFIFDPQSGVSSPMAMIACRDDFLSGECKREDLRDVVFPAGLLKDGQGGARLFCGTSDCEVQWLDIPSPFGDRWQ
ncbi:MAG: DUF1861 family protein [Kluyvera intermedia]